MSSDLRARISLAERVVEMAWAELPDAHRRLLTSVGATQRQVVAAPLGDEIDGLLRSAGHDGLSPADRRRFAKAVGVWIPDLRLTIVNVAHPALAGLDESSFEALVATTVWHEWGHALSIVRAEDEDISAGPRLLEVVPPGIAESIRNGGYGHRELTHEIVAEIYALLMIRRRAGAAGRPTWLDAEVYNLMRRVSGWIE